MSKGKSLTPTLVLLLSYAVAAYATAAGSPSGLFHGAARASSEREQDGLAGPVRRVKTETAKITVKNGKPAEGPRTPLETTTYDQKGNRVDTAYFLAAGGSLTGKEVYKYDERGNIVEMTLHGGDGSLVAREVYTYEFDAVGNWVKMTTAVAVVEGGKVTFEPSEVTYRTISYYLDEAVMAKMSQAPAQAAPRNMAATLSVASLDRDALAPAVVPGPAAADPNGAAAGPSVSAEGEAPAAPVRTGPLKPVSGGILNGKAVSLPPPAYPEAARRTRTSGTVAVEVVVDVSGKVISAKAVSGPVLLQQAAEMAARLARFTPTLISGQPTRVAGVINYNFSLQQ